MQRQHQKAIESLEDPNIPVFIGRTLFDDYERAQYNDGLRLVFLPDFSERCLIESHELFPKDDKQRQMYKYYALPPKALVILDFAVRTERNQDVEPKLEDKIFRCGLNGSLFVELVENKQIASSFELNGNQLPFFDEMKKVIINKAQNHRIFVDSLEGLEQTVGTKEIIYTINKADTDISNKER